MSSPRIEAFLARLYTDQAVLDRFLADPAATLAGAGLDAAEQRSFATIDRDDLVLAAQSIRAKRAARRPPGLAARLRRWRFW